MTIIGKMIFLNKLYQEEFLKVRKHCKVSKIQHMKMH